MQYLGGKSRISREISKEIRSRYPTQTFWDPFCGGLSMSIALGGDGLASDASPPLIALYQAIAKGWHPPTEVTEEEYQKARTLPDADPLKGFIGFACSYGGKYFGGYARATKDRPTRNYAKESAKVLISDINQLKTRGVHFERIDWLDEEPIDLGCILYLDPPYANTTGYKSVSSFDHAKFIDRVKDWSEFSSIFVSEYNLSLGSVCWEKPHSTRISGKGEILEDKIERLYYIKRGSL